MSYVICRVLKYNKGETAGVSLHHSRKKEAYESNPDIDPSRSKNNFYFGDILNMQQRVAEEIKNRACMQEGKKRRKDAVHSFEVLISASPDWWPENWKEMSKDEFGKTDCFMYLVEAANAMQNRFTKENFIGAAIHLDEATPHMSIVFVPIINNKLCAKEILTKRVLQDLQTEVGKIGNKYGLERGVARTGEERKRHLATEEYKAKADLAKLRKEIDDTLAEYDKLRNELNDLKAENEQLKNALEREKMNLQAMLKATKLQLEKLTVGLSDDQKAQVEALIESFSNSNEESQVPT